MDPISPRQGRPAPVSPAEGDVPALWLPRSGMGRSARIRRILELAGWRITHRASSADAFAGWGRKDSGLDAARRAAALGKPALAVEDGFLRSVGLGLEGAQPISLTVDGRGVYYDAGVPSDLEVLLGQGDLADPALLRRARHVRERLVAERLTKYNASHEPWPARLPGTGYVLVVDQTRGDRGLVYGGADGETFRRMLHAARADNPGAPVLVKTHPDVLTGKRRGCFEPEDLAAVRDLHLCTEDVDPWLLLEGAARVYTATSQLGFEAVLAEKPVRVFGAPFYAGWGLTDDAAELPRRGRRLSLDAFVAGVLVSYPLYYDPLHDELCPVETAIDRLVLWRDRRRANRTPSVCLGFAPAEKPLLSAALQAGPRRPSFARSSAAAVTLAKTSGGRIVAAQGAVDAALRDRCRTAGIPLVAAHPGPFPHLGTPRGDTVSAFLLDDVDPSTSSRIEARIAAGDFPPDVIARAERLIDHLRRSWSDRAKPVLPQGGRIVLAAASPSGDGTPDLLRAIRAAHPRAHVAFAPSNRGSPCPPGADRLVEAADLGDWIAGADEVWTLSSWIGLRALIADKPVVAGGETFCAGWGLTRDFGTARSRGRRAALAELVAAALLLGPVYVDRETGLPCDAEFAFAPPMRLENSPSARPRTGSVLARLAGTLRRAIGRR